MELRTLGGESALFVAVRARSIDIVRQLLWNQCNPFTFNNLAQHPLTELQTSYQTPINRVIIRDIRIAQQVWTFSPRLRDKFRHTTLPKFNHFSVHNWEIMTRPDLNHMVSMSMQR
jgi:hypothetical protein